MSECPDVEEVYTDYCVFMKPHGESAIIRLQGDWKTIVVRVWQEDNDSTRMIAVRTAVKNSKMVPYGVELA